MVPPMRTTGQSSVYGFLLRCLPPRWRLGVARAWGEGQGSPDGFCHSPRLPSCTLSLSRMNFRELGESAQEAGHLSAHGSIHSESAFVNAQ